MQNDRNQIAEEVGSIEGAFGKAEELAEFMQHGDKGDEDDQKIRGVLGVGLPNGVHNQNVGRAIQSVGQAVQNNVGQSTPSNGTAAFLHYIPQVACFKPTVEPYGAGAK